MMNVPMPLDVTLLTVDWRLETGDWRLATIIVHCRLQNINSKTN
jgi:hypothetical protein